MNIAKVVVSMLLAVFLFGCINSDGSEYEQRFEESKKLPTDYMAEKAIENGDVVDLLGKISNLDKLDSFIQDVKDNKESFVRLVRYTLEGDPIIFSVFYDKKQIKCYIDNTRDQYGGNSTGIKEVIYSKIEMIVDDSDDNKREYDFYNEEGNVADRLMVDLSKDNSKP